MVLLGLRLETEKIEQLQLLFLGLLMRSSYWMSQISSQEEQLAAVVSSPRPSPKLVLNDF